MSQVVYVLLEDNMFLYGVFSSIEKATESYVNTDKGNPDNAHIYKATVDPNDVGIVEKVVFKCDYCQTEDRKVRQIDVDGKVYLLCYTCEDGLGIGE